VERGRTGAPLTFLEPAKVAHPDACALGDRHLRQPRLTPPPTHHPSKIAGRSLLIFDQG